MQELEHPQRWPAMPGPGYKARFQLLRQFLGHQNQTRHSPPRRA